MAKIRTARTRIELIAIIMIVIAVTLAAIAIPRMSRNSATAQAMTCQTNISIMNTQVEAYYSEKEVWPTDLDAVTANTNYFPKGAPSCPTGGYYSIDRKSHRVSCSIHGQQIKD